MLMLRLTAISIVLCAACAPEPATGPVLDLDGARNEAFRAAADRYGLPLDWLVAVAYQQGRFERAELASDPDAPAEPEDASEVLAEDTPLDETMPTPPDDGLGDKAHEDPPDAWGVMFLSDAQVEQAAAFTGRDADAIRTDLAANIDGAAALIADGYAAGGRTDDALRTATAGFFGLAYDPEAAELTLSELDETLRNGFDVTTEDGERISLTGTAPDPETAEAVAPGKYPTTQWIASPNHSTRQGFPIRFIVVHDIEGTMAGAIAVFKRASSQASAHYITRARDGHIVKMVLESQNAWHAGHGWFNRNSIGIEHEGFAHRKNGGGFYTDRQYRASARLACAIAHRNKIPVDRKHIFGHMNVPSNVNSRTLCSDKSGIAGKCSGVSHHSDPSRFWNWTKYMSLVRSCVKAAG
jgi:N-acetyl-anhydromuramyl-L-alanine amidase AmpD